MSSNNLPYTAITRHNYEEFFFLYVDNELTPHQKEAVETFVLRHPDLKEELDLLCSTQLPVDDVPFENKSELFADSMKVAATDESLLLYMDGELPAWEAKIVEAELKKNAAFALQYQSLLKTKAQKDERIIYPDKKELYRRAERRMVPVWMRVAAAVLIVAGAGTAAWLGMDHSKTSGENVAVVLPKPAIKQTAPVVENPDVSTQREKPVIKTERIAAVRKKPLVKKEKTEAQNTVVVTKPSIKKKKERPFSKPHIAAENALATNNLPAAKNTDGRNEQTKPVDQTKQVLNNGAVTSETTPAYVQADDAAAKTAVPVNAVATTTTSEKSGGSVKGFLRKATRFIERRTGIKTVNDDNELLVGAVALKL